MRAPGRIDWSSSAIDGTHIRALLGPHPGPSPVDRARSGSKHHLITDAGGVPLAISLTGGQRDDVTQLMALIDGIGPVAGRSAGPASAPSGCWPITALTSHLPPSTQSA